MIATIDPDVDWCGLALGTAEGEIAALVVARLSDGLVEWRPGDVSLRAVINRIVVEVPDSVRVDPNDLFASLAAGAAMAGAIATDARCPIDWRRASAWTGTISKSMREARTIAALRKEERELLERIPRTHRSEAISAAGLLMFETGRTVRGGGLKHG